jgi:positive regulator of sigma E activity
MNTEKIIIIRIQEKGLLDVAAIGFLLRLLGFSLWF